MVVLFLLMVSWGDPPESLWRLSEGLSEPQAVVFDPAGKMIYVANRGGGKGYISQIGMNGKQRKAKWLTGLNGPMGMAISGNSLWVATSDTLVEVDLNTAAIKRQLKPAGARALRGVAVDANQNVFTSDLHNRLYRLTDGRLELFSQGSHLHQPAHILAEEGQIMIACQGGPQALGAIRALPLLDGATTLLWSGPIGRLNGLASDGNFGYYVTDQAKNQLVHVSDEGKAQTLLTTGREPAGLCRLEGMLLMVEVGENRLRALKLP